MSKNLADDSNEWELVELKLADLDFSIVTDLRTALDDDAVEAYLRDWDQLPPIDVYIDPETGEKRVVDGGHRGAAGKLGKKKLIKCRTKKGTKREAELEAMGRNEHHGVRRTNEEKRKIVEKLLNDSEWRKMSARWMQERTGVDAKVIRAIKRERQEEAAAKSGAAAAAPGVNAPQPDPVVGKDGKEYPARLPLSKPRKKKTGAKMGFDGPTQRTAPVDEYGNELASADDGPTYCALCGEIEGDGHDCETDPESAPAREEDQATNDSEPVDTSPSAPLPGRAPPPPPDTAPVRVPVRVDLAEFEVAALQCVTEPDPTLHGEFFDDWENTEGHGTSPEADARAAVLKLGVRFE